MAEGTLSPSTSGSVVLDLGPGTGALVLHTPPELDGEEIEISLASATRAQDALAGQAAARCPTGCNTPPSTPAWPPVTT